MSEGKDKQKSNYCKWCDTLGNSVIKLLEDGKLVWVGCPDCYVKKKERENNDTISE